MSLRINARGEPSDLRSAVLTCAARLFLEQGLDATTMACLLVSLLASCTSLRPGAALATTLPVEVLGEKVAPLGEVEGSACQSDVLFVFPVESDSSIATAKARALASLKPAPAMTALIDVTIDEERYTSFFYNQRCTVLRGRALASSGAAP